MIDADVCNMALGFIGKQPIVTLSDNTSNALKCKLYYDVCRQQVLRNFEWGGARRQEELALIDKDYKGWAYVYEYPQNCILAYKVFNSNQTNSEFNLISINDNVKGIASQIPHAWIEYLYDMKDLSLFPPDLISAFAHLLASKVAIALAGSSATAKEQLDLYHLELLEAKHNMAIEENNRMRMGEFTYLRSRG